MEWKWCKIELHCETVGASSCKKYPLLQQQQCCTKWSVLKVVSCVYVHSCFVVTNKRFRVCCLGNLQVSRWQLGVFCSFFNKYYSKQYSWHNTCVRGRLWMAVCIVPIPKHNVVGGSAVVILELEWTDCELCTLIVFYSMTLVELI